MPKIKTFENEKVSVKCKDCGYIISLHLPKAYLKNLATIDIYCMDCGGHSAYKYIYNADELELIME
jgi:Zn finger protein HypA/HybF involved in hydrogenase expression